MIRAKRSFVKRKSVSLNNEKNCHEISEDKIAICEKTAGR